MGNNRRGYDEHWISFEGLGRASSFVNIAALHIVNAANIQAQGGVIGVPVVQAPNMGALSEASNTAGAAAQQAAVPPPRNNEQPSVTTRIAPSR
ncbi:filamentous haemagglutinin family protein [Bradyrhizobium erythrophlei]|uniref:filamentous haemagglutinin family protein n=1 Tax=Bradyrhizobium erythrophlei TaxID=1437360 RepID=UPI000B84307D|nr:filamentous haemagglutinin family protein [Bradyrhizobium erythrophlei]